MQESNANRAQSRTRERAPILPDRARGSDGSLFGLRPTRQLPPPRRSGIVAAIGAFWVEAVAIANAAQPQRPRTAAAIARQSSDTVKISTWARARNQTSGEPMTSSAGTDPNVRAVTQSAAPSSNAFVIVNAVSGWTPTAVATASRGGRQQGIEPEMRELLAPVADQCGLSNGTGAVGESGFWRLGSKPPRKADTSLVTATAGAARTVAVPWPGTGARRRCGGESHSTRALRSAQRRSRARLEPVWRRSLGVPGVTIGAPRNLLD